MNEWDEVYKRLNKADPQLESEDEDDIVYAVFGAIIMVVAVGVTLGMIFFGAKLLEIL